MKIYRSEALLIKDDLERVFKKYKIKVYLDIYNDLLENMYISYNNDIKFIDLENITKLSELYNQINTLLI